MNLEDSGKALDVVQVVFNVMEQMLHRIHDHSGDAFYKSRYQSSEIITELNRRFEENKVGYRYSQGQIKKILEGPQPLPLKERLIAGEPASNLRKIADLIGGYTVTAIHDPYTTTGSLNTMLKLAGMGVGFNSSLRILGTSKPFSNSTERKSFLSLLSDINTERKTSWQVRIYPTTSKPHRRFLVLSDPSKLVTF